MTDPLRVRVSGPLEPFAAGFASELFRQGYALDSVGLQMYLVAHLSRWLAGEGKGAGVLSGEVAEAFSASRRAAGYTSFLTVRALLPLLGYLRELGVAPVPVAPGPCGPVEVLLERYGRYLRVERGVVPRVAQNYVGNVRPFLQTRVSPDGLALDLERLDGGNIVAFVLEVCPGCSRSMAKLTVTALRSLLGFLHVEGEIDRPLAASVPSVAGWRLSGLPKGIEPGELARLFESCDRSTVNGRRDFAILMMLSRLALRAGEVTACCLDDIDWSAGEIVVRGKGERRDRLPLPSDVGGAIAAYLRDGRPVSSEGRVLFVRVKAPHRGLGDTGVTQVVLAASRRAGLGAIYAHRLRHTAASEMLRAGGTLPEIGQVLRHRHISTTAIYAKVDLKGLRTIAPAWPGGEV
jgi:integrase/recombinase XerD